MELVSTQEMQEIDRRTIQEIGIPGCVLMENAGRAVAEAIRDFQADISKPIWIFCGKGNNGGDGFVIARYLQSWGYSVKLWLLAQPSEFSGDAAIHLGVAQNLGLPIEVVDTSEQIRSLAWKGCSLIVDCIFGTGLRGAVRGFAAELITAINDSHQPVVSVDIPSGLNANTGWAEGACVQASITVTIGLPKRGLRFASQVGECRVVDIGFPRQVIDEMRIQVREITENEAIARIPTRPKHSHKGSFGRVLTIAGSTGMTGAAALCSEAALRAGAGLSTLCIPSSLNHVLEVKLTEVMTRPLPETDAGTLSWQALPAIMELAERANVLAIGPGLSTHPETVKLIQHLCTHLTKPCVIDADAINSLSLRPECLESLPTVSVLTPHLGEMARLLGCDIAQIQRDPITVAQEFASRYGAVLVLKGAPTVIASPDGTAWVNTSGNPGMATGGTGDVLTGLIAGCIAQGLSPLDAAILGVYVHGMAGDMAAANQGMHSMLAGDLLASVPQALRALVN